MLTEENFVNAYEFHQPRLLYNGANPAFAIALLYPPETSLCLAYEYEPTAERVIGPEELRYPFGPMEIEAGKPVS